jgi:hypothetical protein
VNSGDEGQKDLSAGNAQALLFSCPACGGQIRVHAVGQSLSAACSHCTSVVDVSTRELKILQKAQKATKKIDPDIKLDSVGTLGGVRWRVIGIILQTDSTEMWYWVEYLLFNPHKGFRWLVENQGHWTQFKKTKYKPKTTGNTATLYNNTYKLYTADESKVVQAIGEFYWRIQVGESNKVKDYINPPEMLSMAKSDSDVVWSIGEYLPLAQVEEAFNLKSQLPLQNGVAPHQPSPHAHKIGPLYKRAGILFAALVASQIAFSCGRNSDLVMSETFEPAAATLRAGKQLVSQPFVMPKGIHSLEVQAEANVNNQWVNLGMTLINTKSNEAINFDHEISYYSGYEGGESWSEGSPRTNRLLSAVKGGTYILTIDPSNLEKLPDKRLQVTLYRDVFFMGNFWLGLIYIVMLPLLIGALNVRFEMSRWENSDYSPYNVED